jgi:phosphomannomutase
MNEISPQIVCEASRKISENLGLSRVYYKVLGISSNIVNNYVMFKPHIFREYDVRGKAGVDFDEDFALNFGKAYASHLHSIYRGRNLVVGVGRDNRLSSDALFNSLVRGITEVGVEVVSVRPNSCDFNGISNNFDGGIMITGSHNLGIQWI